MISDYDVALLRQLFDPAECYAGYRPSVRELPNGDGKVDEQKKYLHVALKYNPPVWAKRVLFEAHGMALEVARALNLPASLTPDLAAGALRLVEYPTGAGSAPHCDMSLFTVNVWRSCANAGLAAHSHAGYSVHFGELAEVYGIAQADSHHVQGLPFPQVALVYFALPRHDTKLPHPAPHLGAGVPVPTVGDWLAARMSRSRATIHPGTTEEPQ